MKFTWGSLLIAAACGGTDTATIPDASDDAATVNDGGGTDGSTGPDATSGDGASTDGTTIDSGTFDPAKVSGLVLWLEADVGASIVQQNGRITQWKDQTSHHNDAN